MSEEHNHELRRSEADRQEPEPETRGTPSESVDTAQTPEAVQATKTARTPRRDTDRLTPAVQELRRARGVEWVRPTDLIARHGAALAGRGIDFEAELARRTRTPITRGVRDLGERARPLPPLSAFGRSPTARTGPARPGVGMS